MDHASTNAGGESHGSIAAYLTGFGLSVLLTAAAFGLVMSGVVTGTQAIGSVAVLAVIQIMVHLYYFLHMNGSSEQRWNVTAFAFTAVIVAIVVGGTLWVMYNANTLMMPHMGMLPH